MCKSLCPSNVGLPWHKATTDTTAPVETPQEETREPVSDNDSEQYPEDEIPEDEEEEDEEDEDDDPDDADYKVTQQSFSIRFVLDDSHFRFSEPFLSVFDKQTPPTTATQENKDGDDEGTMPPYDQETQNLIDGKCMFKTEWLSQFRKSKWVKL